MDTSFLSVKEISAKLGVSEKTIYRMINSNSIPYGLKIGGQWRFNSEKIDKWIQQKNQPSGSSTAADTNISLCKAIDESTIMYRIHGSNRDETLDQVLGISNLFSQSEVNLIKKNILYKESIISSSLKGTAVMVADYDIEMHLEKTKLMIAFLDSPKDFKGVDGEMTTLVFIILPANKSEQLIISTKLNALLMDLDFLESIRQEPNRAEVIDLIQSKESELFVLNSPAELKNAQ